MKTTFRFGLFALVLLALLVLVRLDKPREAPLRERTLILVSLDGFCWDYLDEFKAQTPHLNQLASEGVRMERLIPVFPSLTFPNHYTIVRQADIVTRW